MITLRFYVVTQLIPTLAVKMVLCINHLEVAKEEKVLCHICMPHTIEWPPRHPMKDQGMEKAVQAATQEKLVIS